MSAVYSCGALNKATKMAKKVSLHGMGTEPMRSRYGCVFIDLRDREGLTQIVFDPTIDSGAHEKAGQLRSEWVMGVRGKVRSRGGNTNPRLATGEIEIATLKHQRSSLRRRRHHFRSKTTSTLLRKFDLSTAISICDVAFRRI